MVMVTHEARAAAAADRILFLADGRIIKDLGRAGEDEILDTIREVTLDVIRVALRGLAGTEVPRCADGARDRARGRDGQRHVRPDRHDRPGVRHDLRRVVRQHRCGNHRQGARHRVRGRQRRSARVPASLLGASRALWTSVEAATGSVIDETATKILKPDGKAINTRGAPSFGFGIDPCMSRLQPAEARRRHLADRPRRGRDRRGRPRTSRATASATPCASAR